MKCVTIWAVATTAPSNRAPNITKAVTRYSGRQHYTQLLLNINNQLFRNYQADLLQLKTATQGKSRTTEYNH